MAKIKLIPIDKRRCQVKILKGSFMTLGPRHYKRCENKATWIATEKKPNKEDGKIGKMSLCDDCKRIFIKKKGHRYASFEKIVNRQS